MRICECPLCLLCAYLCVSKCKLCVCVLSVQPQCLLITSDPVGLWRLGWSGVCVEVWQLRNIQIVFWAEPQPNSQPPASAAAHHLQTLTAALYLLLLHTRTHTLPFFPAHSVICLELPSVLKGKFSLTLASFF